MKKEVVIVFVLLIIIAVFLALIFIDFDTEEKPNVPVDSSGGLGSINPIAEPEGSSAADNETPVETPTVPVAGSGGGGGSSDGWEVSESNPLPVDLYTAPCGTYFTRYDVCAGSCPEGGCVKEGRSCYCKIQ